MKAIRRTGSGADGKTDKRGIYWKFFGGTIVLSVRANNSGLIEAPAELLMTKSERRELVIGLKPQIIDRGASHTRMIATH